jgi:hypothetical protein
MGGGVGGTFPGAAPGPAAALTGVPHRVQNAPLTEAPQVVQKAMNYSSTLLTVRHLTAFGKQLLWELMGCPTSARAPVHRLFER